jgi:predicted HTH domain antitoxin
MTEMQVLEIPQDILDSTRLTLEELKVELAVTLAEKSLWEFRQILASRQISPHYDVDDLEDDISALRDLGQM